MALGQPIQPGSVNVPSSVTEQDYKDFISYIAANPSIVQTPTFTSTRVPGFDANEKLRASVRGAHVDPLNLAMQYADLEDYYAKQQTGLNQIMKFVPRVAVKALGEIFKMPGYLVGAGIWATTGFDVDEVGKLVDNSYLNFFDKLQNETNEKLLKVYTPEAVRNGSIWRSLASSSFWATQGADGVGFLLAALFPGQVLRALRLGQGVVEGLSPLLKLSKPFTKAANMVAEGGIGEATGLSSKFLEGVAKTLPITNKALLAERVDDVAAVISNTLYEASSEAGDTYRKMKESGATNQEAGKAAVGNLLANTAILLPSNVLEQKWLFNAFRSAEHAAERATKHKLAEALGNALRKEAPTSDKFLDILNAELKNIPFLSSKKAFFKEALPGFFSEGFYEEGFQWTSDEMMRKRALGKDSKPFIEDLITTYADGLLHSLDFQQSVALGSFLGTFMSGIGGVRENAAEKRFIQGTPEVKKEDISWVGRLVGKKPREAHKGYAAQMKDNLVKRYSLNDIFEYEYITKEEFEKRNKGNATATAEASTAEFSFANSATGKGETKKGDLIKVVKLQDGIPVVDMAKLLQYSHDNLDEAFGKAFMEMNKATNEEAFEFFKFVSDMNYMIPYFQVEGGMDILKGHIDELAKADARFMNAQFGRPAGDVNKIAEELKRKANQFKKIYDTVVDLHLTHKSSKIDFIPSDGKEINGTDLAWAEEFLVNQLLPRRLTSSMHISFLKGRIAELESRIAEIKGSVEDINNLTKEQKELLVRYRKQLESYKKDYQTEDSAQTHLYTKEDVQESYKEFVETKKLVRDKIKETKSNENIEDIENAETAEEVDNAVKSQKETEESQKSSPIPRAKATRTKNKKKESGRTVTVKKEEAPIESEKLPFEEETGKIPETKTENKGKFPFSSNDTVTGRLFNSLTPRDREDVLRMWEEGEATNIINEIRKRAAKTFEGRQILEDENLLDTIKEEEPKEEEPAPKTSKTKGKETPEEVFNENTESQSTKDVLVAADKKKKNLTKPKKSTQTELEESQEKTRKENKKEAKKGVEEEVSLDVVIARKDLDDNGEVSDDLDPRILRGELWGAGKRVRVFVDTSSPYYKKGMPADEVPIAVELVDEDGGKFNIHTKSWYIKRGISENNPVVKELAALRKKVAEEGPQVLTIVGREGGVVYRNEIAEKANDRDAFEVFPEDSGVVFGVLKRDGTIRLPKGFKGKIVNKLFNEKSGTVVAVIPRPDGNFEAVKIFQRKLFDYNQRAYESYVKAVAAIMVDYSAGRTLGINTQRKLIAELRKYFYVDNTYDVGNISAYKINQGRLFNVHESNFRGRPVLFFEVSDPSIEGGVGKYFLSDGKLYSYTKTPSTAKIVGGEKEVASILNDSLKGFFAAATNVEDIDGNIDILLHDNNGNLKRYTTTRRKLLAGGFFTDVRFIQDGDRRHYIINDKIHLSNHITAIPEDAAPPNNNENNAGSAATTTKHSPVEVTKTTPEEGTKVTPEEKTISSTNSILEERKKINKSKSNIPIIKPRNFDKGESTIFSFARRRVEPGIDYNNTSLSAFLGFTSYRDQQDIIRSLTRHVLGIIDDFSAAGMEITPQRAIDILLDRLHEYKDIVEGVLSKGVIEDSDLEKGILPNMEDNEYVLQHLDHIVNLFDEIKDNNGQTVFVGFRNLIKMELGQLNFELNSLTEEIEDSEDAVLERRNFLEGTNYKLDPASSLSAQVKRMLFFVEQVDENGNPILNAMGLPKYYDYKAVFNSLMFALADVPNHLMEETLLRYANKSRLFAQVVDKLNTLAANNPEIKNQFFSVFRKQSTRYKILRFRTSYDSRGNAYSHWNVIDANRSNASGVLTDQWQSRAVAIWQKMGLYEPDAVGEYILNENKAKQVLREFSEIASINNKDEQIRRLADFLNRLGIAVSEEALYAVDEDITSKSERFTMVFKKKIPEDFSEFVDTFISLVVRRLTGASKNKVTLADNDPFTTESSTINGLASYQLPLDPTVFSVSFRGADRELRYSFVNPHMLSDLMVQLQDADFAAALLEIPYYSNNEWLQKLSEGDVDFIKSFGLFYFDAAKGRVQFLDSKPFDKQSMHERLATRLAMFQNSGNSTGLFFTNTPSDKKVFTLVEAPKIDIDVDPTIFRGGGLDFDKLKAGFHTSKALQKILNIVNSEVNRINTVVEEVKTLDDSDLVPGYHYITTKSGKRVLGAGAYFFSFPILNDIAIRDKDGAVTFDEDALIDVLASYIEGFTYDILEQASEGELVNLETGENKFSSSYMRSIGDKVSSKSLRNRVAYAAFDYVINSIVATFNYSQIVTGDPAFFASDKMKEVNDWRDVVQNSITTYFKRTTKDIAPGTEGWFNNESSPFVTYLLLNDPTISSALTKYKGKLGKVFSTYDSIDMADAQEWVTAEEHINTLYSYGRISKKDYDTIMNKLKNNEDLTVNELYIAMYPEKPVSSGFYQEDEVNARIPFYVKTSAIPLFPQLTRHNPQLDKFRRILEKNGHRAILNTGTKVGYKNPLELFDENGNVRDDIDENEDFSIHTISIDRSALKIQQEMPHRPYEHDIMEGSQTRKFRYADIPSDFVFSLGKNSLTAHDMKTIDGQIHEELMTRRLNNLINEIGARKNPDGTPVIDDVNKLRNVLISEAIKRGYSLNDILSFSTLQVTEGSSIFSIPLFFHGSNEKVEALLNSIITDRVLKNRVEGSSPIQVSATGFGFGGNSVSAINEEIAKELSEGKNPVVYTREYDGKGLKYEVKKNGDEEYVEAQVLVPFKFFKRKANGELVTDAKGNPIKLNIKDYVDEDGTIDPSKLDDEILDSIGYRIPTAGHSNIVKLRVVGFLPDIFDETIVVPPEIVKQMGSDFDVDKLYIHSYNYTTDKNGKISKIRSRYNLNPSDKTISKINDLSNAALQNVLLDMHMTMSKTTHVASMQMSPLDNDSFANILDHINSLRERSSNNSERAEILRVLKSDMSIEEKFDAIEEFLRDKDRDEFSYVVSRLDERSTKNLSELTRYFELLNKYKERRGDGSIMVDHRSPTGSSYLFSPFQDSIVDINSEGKDGLAIIASSMSSHADFQLAGVHFTSLRTKTTDVELPILFLDENGNLYEDDRNSDDFKTNRVIPLGKVKYGRNTPRGAWRLDKIYTFPDKNGNREIITNILRDLLTEAVDNAKNQRMYGLTLNRTTIPVAVMLARLGIPRTTIMAFINQPIIREFVNEIAKMQRFYDPTISSFENMANEILMKFASRVDEGLAHNIASADGDFVTPFKESELEENIAKGEAFTKDQIRILSNFVTYLIRARTLAMANSATNVDTAFLPSNFAEVLNMVDSLTKLFSNKFINLGSLVDKNTSRGAGITNGLGSILNMFMRPDIAVYAAPFYQELRNLVVSQLTGDAANGLSVQRTRVLNNAIRSAILSDVIFRNDKSLSDGRSLAEDRQSLLYDTEDNKSLATEILELRDKIENKFLDSLVIVPTYNENDPKIVEFDSSKSIDSTLANDLTESWYALITSDVAEERNVGFRLLKYAAYFNPNIGSRSFARFMPVNIFKMKDFPIADALHDAMNGKSYKDLPVRLYVELVRHNPSLTRSISEEDIATKINQKGEVVKAKGPSYRITLTENTVARVAVKDPSDNSLKPPMFLHMYYGDKVFLYQLSGGSTLDNAEYTVIETKGDSKNLLSEYDLGDLSITIFEPNKIEGLSDVKSTTSTVPATKTSPVTKTTVKPKSSTEFGLTVGATKESEETLTQALNAEPDQVQQKLYQILLDKLRESESDKVTFVGVESIEGGGPEVFGRLVFNVNKKGNERQVAPSQVLVNMSNFVNLDADMKIRVLFHEITHYLIARETLVKARMNKLSEKQAEAYNNLNLLYLKLKANPKFVETMNEYSRSSEKLEEDPSYYLTSFDDFLVGVMTSELFREELAKVEDEETKQPLLKRIMDLILEILGLDIPEGTALYTAFANVFTLMEIEGTALSNRVNEERVAQEIKEPKYLEPKSAEEVKTGSTIYQELGNKTETGNVKIVKDIFEHKTDKNIITAFRVDKKLGLLESFRRYNAIGNPINWQNYKPRFEGDNATIAFIDWFLGRDFTNIEQEYRQVLLSSLDKLKGLPIEYYKELGRPSHATALDYLINKYSSKSAEEESGQTNNNLGVYTMHSGGAIGSDSQWGSIGKEYGLLNINHYYYKDRTPSGNTSITEAQFKEGIEMANAAARAMYGFKYSFKDNKVGRLLSRNWQQVKNSDAVYAIGQIFKKGEKPFGDSRVALKEMVGGGTGYAVEMAIQSGKPVYVFDQVKKKWFTWKNNRFVETETPVLTENFAGIGTRQINKYGIQAIRGVYEKTLKHLNKAQPTPKEVITGSIVKYKGDYYFVREINESGRVKLTNVDGRNMPGTPLLKNVEHSGTDLPSTVYHGTQYFYSEKLDRLFTRSGVVFENKDNPQRKQIIEQIKNNTFDFGVNKGIIPVVTNDMFEVLEEEGKTSIQDLNSFQEFMKMLPTENKRILAKMIRENRFKVKCR